MQQFVAICRLSFFWKVALTIHPPLLARLLYPLSLQCVVTFCVTYTISSTIHKYGADPNDPKEEVRHGCINSTFAPPRIHARIYRRHAQEEDPFADYFDDEDDNEPEIYELKDLRKVFFPTPADYEPPKPIGS